MKCDIILPVWDVLQLTRVCVESLIRHTHYPYRIIAIDNGSGEQTKKYLEGLKNIRDMEILLIRNEQNLGFVKGVNQGLRASRAPYICILNNDTTLSDGWLSEMVEIAEDDSQIGILNPSSNTLGQYLRSNDTVDSYAKGLRHLKGEWQEMGQCGGFCMLIKRNVIDKIGFFDEIFGVGYCEETDFCRRAQRFGFKSVRAKASYVYHKDSTSFNKRGDRKHIFERSHDIFYRRWGKPLRIAYLVGDYLKNRQHKINEISLEAARDNHQVWLFLKKSLKGSYGPPEHFNIRFFWLNSYFYRILSIYKILKRKKKKKMDIILTDDKVLYNILMRLKSFHGVDVVFEPFPEKAKGLWNERSVYP